MKHHYKDLTEQLDKIYGEPFWWDENGVPRYCDFTPGECSNIYANQVVLLLIGCQGCGTEFKVCMSSDPFEKSMHAEILDHALHYGDPPNYGCCDAGPTMNSEPLRVLEFWKRNTKHEWERVPDLEVELLVNE